MLPFDQVISIVAIILSVIAIVISFSSLYYTHFYRPNSLIAFLYDYQFNKITSDQLDFDLPDEDWIELSLNLQLINNGKRNNVILYMYIYIFLTVSENNIEMSVYHLGTGKAYPNTMTIPHGSIQNVKLKSCYPFRYFTKTINCPTKFGIIFSVVTEDGTKYESRHEMGNVDFLNELVPHFQTISYSIFNLLESGESPGPITMSFENSSNSELYELAKKMKN